LEKVKKRDHSEELGIDGRVILKRIREMDFGGADWLHLAEERDRWRALSKRVINL
jgi:hypothetical protein